MGRGVFRGTFPPGWLPRLDAAGRHDRLGVIVRTQQAMPTAGALRRPSTQHEVQSSNSAPSQRVRNGSMIHRIPLFARWPPGPHALCPDDPHLRSGGVTRRSPRGRPRLAARTKRRTETHPRKRNEMLTRKPRSGLFGPSSGGRFGADPRCELDPVPVDRAVVVGDPVLMRRVDLAPG